MKKVAIVLILITYPCECHPFRLRPHILSSVNNINLFVYLLI